MIYINLSDDSYQFEDKKKRAAGRFEFLLLR